MMQYKYRWFYALVIGLIITILSYWLMLLPGMHKLTNNKKEVERLQNELSLLRKAQPSVNLKTEQPVISKTAFLELLPLLAQDHHIVMRSVAMKPIMSQGEVRMKLIIQGDFSHLSQFSLALTKRGHNILIESFSYQTNKDNKLQLALDLLLMRRNIPNEKESENLDSNLNPFCVATDSIGRIAEHDRLAVSTLSIMQMKMTGYFFQVKRQEALVRLPTGVLIEINVGDQLGVEQAIVTSIHADRIEMILPNDEKKIIKMDVG